MSRIAWPCMLDMGVGSADLGAEGMAETVQGPIPPLRLQSLRSAEPQFNFLQQPPSPQHTGL